MAKQTSSKNSDTAKKKRPSEAPAPITKTIVKADAAKPAPEKSEPVAVVRDVVISTEPSHDQIAQRAFELFETRGHHEGNQLADWLTAERELRA